MKKYIPVNTNDKRITHLKCEVDYSLGGVNYFTYRNEPRGYYVHVSPVERREEIYGGRKIISEGYMCFSGVKQLVKAVSRKSAKAQAEAEKLAETIFPELIAHVCSEQGITLAMEMQTAEAVETVA